MIILSKKDKLIKKIKSRPKDFTMDEAEALFGYLGGKKSNKGKTSGSKIRFTLGDLNIDLHKPHPANELKPYQIKQIIDQLEKEGII